MGDRPSPPLLSLQDRGRERNPCRIKRSNKTKQNKTTSRIQLTQVGPSKVSSHRYDPEGLILGPTERGGVEDSVTDVRTVESPVPYQVVEENSSGWSRRGGYEGRQEGGVGVRRRLSRNQTLSICGGDNRVRPCLSWVRVCPTTDEPEVSF